MKQNSDMKKNLLQSVLQHLIAVDTPRKDDGRSYVINFGIEEYLNGLRLLAYADGKDFPNGKRQFCEDSFLNGINKAIEAYKLVTKVPDFQPAYSYLDFVEKYNKFSKLYREILTDLSILGAEFNYMKMIQKKNYRKLIAAINLIIREFNRKINNLRYNYRKNFTRDEKKAFKISKIDKFFEFRDNLEIDAVDRYLRAYEKVFDKFFAVPDYGIVTSKTR